MRGASVSRVSEYQQFPEAVLEIPQLLNKVPLRQSESVAHESESDLC